MGGLASCWIREAADSCNFDASLEELAVKHGGRQPSLKWIEQMLKKQNVQGDTDAIGEKVKQSPTLPHHFVLRC